MHRNITWILAAAVVVLLLQTAAAGQGYLHGVFVATEHGPIELSAWAEVARNGQLRMAKGSLANVPTLDGVRGILCNLPSWRPGSVFIASDLIFHDERAERREIKFAVRLLNISAFEMHVEDVEQKERLDDLIRAVGGSEDIRTYVFVVLATNGLERLYPFRVTIK
jgi:hypothetical protein